MDIQGPKRSTPRIVCAPHPIDRRSTTYMKVALQDEQKLQNMGYG